jgi:uncharacterized protein (DUF952 family)
MMIETLIYKIAPRDTWTADLPGGRYDGSADDLRDGFIHLSTAEQARETAAKYFAGQDNLVIAAIDVAKLGYTVRWEPSRGGQLFPHVYGPLHADMVVWTKPLPLDADGRHMFPTEIA